MRALKRLWFLSIFTSCFASDRSASLNCCKAFPESDSWPSKSAWLSLNETLEGNLIAAIPPASVCHSDRPNYDNATCAEVTKLWTTSWEFHADDPVSVGENNWSNDTCLPNPNAPCTGHGYPIYVVNASKPEHVQTGIKFARDNNVRLVVKGTGHDFRGRTAAPYSLSIWTRHLRGTRFHEAYQTCGALPADDLNFYSGPAITVAAGENNGAALALANEHGLMVHVGSAPSVGVGGFLTGGGQTLFSSQKGLATDAVLEFSIVLPNGDIVTASACQNTDVFWAVRGGGGSTIGIVLNFTVKTFPSIPITSTTFGFSSPTLVNDAFWSALTYMATQMTMLVTAGITMYASVVPPINESTSWSFSGKFMGLNQSSIDTRGYLAPIAEHFNVSYGSDILASLTEIQEWPSFYDWWSKQVDATPMGIDLAFASRILDEKALNHPNFTDLIKQAAGTGGVAFNGVSGPGTHAYPADFNAACPAWRVGYVHSIVGAVWSPFNTTAKSAAIENLTNVTSAALRKLAPDTGSYVNEASPYEPNYQNAFWGSNYPRLLSIKRKLDPTDVFWCEACVGSERWYIRDDGALCRT
ncbi:uncharacterized protein PV09_07522 [Verruconis gallopava]|uniref:FAD-binding PCMH-type domain-containing protein n=1 Tax=Verruconis gallopava TaxID=253628 RepID=A0A0D2A3N3_9PEZI|nr:uncharacterized protein PV09_07522 [Verruconis gallopava]KIW01005.1 hypothetical protein PV09_07522 [Verruconis gallopava]